MHSRAGKDILRIKTIFKLNRRWDHEGKRERGKNRRGGWESVLWKESHTGTPSPGKTPKVGKGKDKPQLNKGHLEGTCTCFLSGAPGGPQASRKGYIIIEVLELGWPCEVQVVVDGTVPRNSSPRRHATESSGKDAGPGWARGVMRGCKHGWQCGHLVSSCGGNWQQNVSRLVIPLRKPLGASLSRRPAWQGWRSGEGKILETPVFKTKKSLVFQGLFVNKGPSSQGYGLITLTCMNVRVGL